jgi:predicted RNase H-like nuclease (RuvC/YqgF family)
MSKERNINEIDVFFDNMTKEEFIEFLKTYNFNIIPKEEVNMVIKSKIEVLEEKIDKLYTIIEGLNTKIDELEETNDNLITKLKEQCVIERYY